MHFPARGEVGVYGGVRDVPTPNVDRIAHEGIRLNNFNVEYSCTVSRIALLTGRYAARAGGTQATGMTLWEVTIAEVLQDLGYATALFGKWHVGDDDWEGNAATGSSPRASPRRHRPRSRRAEPVARAQPRSRLPQRLAR